MFSQRNNPYCELLSSANIELKSYIVKYLPKKYYIYPKIVNKKTVYEKYYRFGFRN